MMSKKLPLNSGRVIPTAQAPSVNKDEPQSEVASSRKKSCVVNK